MANPKTPRTALIGLVHMAAKQCGQDEDARRDFVESVTGKRSSADCSIGELERVMQAYKDRCGWKKKPRTRKAEAATGQQLKIRALWASLAALDALDDPSDESLIQFVKRVTKTKRALSIEALRFLSAGEAWSVIEALKSWLEREGVDWSLEAVAGWNMVFQQGRAPVLLALWRRYRASDRPATDRGFIDYIRRTLSIEDWERRDFPQVTPEECDRLIKILAADLRAAGRDNVVAFPGVRHG
mgnify:CR=1 FL=1|tara:strand:+ start:10856 stop:11581 length:726 start_codon:yes stop_codon:yes gene_type:complete